ncbi:MAG: 5'/3'-nucleotidase SurE [Treponema sp.]|jgi:5'-nucleotidase|nr:5'/3'-nucleotidase SurE [Treponema sp.]
MNILLTNDDGIDSPGLRLFADALRKKGRDRILILAPDGDRSGVSHSISYIHKPLQLKSLGEDIWSCSGNPADCAMLAVLETLPVKPDLLVSGINRGANLGTDLVFSGTAAAARHGGLHGIPSIALSLFRDGDGDMHFDMASSWAAENLDALRREILPDTFLNVNIPNNPEGPGGMEITFLSKRIYHDTVRKFTAPAGDQFCFVVLGDIGARPEPGSDSDAVFRNLVSLSPVYIHPVTASAVSTGKGR